MSHRSSSAGARAPSHGRLIRPCRRHRATPNGKRRRPLAQEALPQAFDDAGPASGAPNADPPRDAPHEASRQAHAPAKQILLPPFRHKTALTFSLRGMRTCKAGFQSREPGSGPKRLHPVPERRVPIATAPNQPRPVRSRQRPVTSRSRNSRPRPRDVWLRFRNYPFLPQAAAPRFQASLPALPSAPDARRSGTCSRTRHFLTTGNLSGSLARRTGSEARGSRRASPLIS
jgi:hypothetical protein